MPFKNHPPLFRLFLLRHRVRVVAHRVHKNGEADELTDTDTGLCDSNDNKFRNLLGLSVYLVEMVCRKELERERSNDTTDLTDEMKPD